MIVRLHRQKADDRNKESSMKNSFKFFGIIAVVTVIGFFSTGCATPAPVPEATWAGPLYRAVWSHHPEFPALYYVVVGAILVRDQRRETLLETLMNQAIQMGGHDIKNVRLSRRYVRGGPGAQRGEWLTATAVVIQFTSEPVRVATTDSETHAIITTEPVDIGGDNYAVSLLLEVP